MKFALIALMFLPVQEEDVSIWEAKFKHEKAVMKIPGVKRLSIGGIGEKRHIIVTVDSGETAEKVNEFTGGSLEGWPIHVLISREKMRNASGCSNCACSCHQGGRTVVKPLPIDPTSPEEACDVLRKLTRKRVRKGAARGPMCRQMVGWTNDPKRKAWVARNGLPNWPSRELGIGSGEGSTMAYTYIRHRRDCPLRKDTFLDRVTSLTPGK